jgi:transcription antitermination factor NusG
VVLGSETDEMFQKGRSFIHLPKGRWQFQRTAPKEGSLVTRNRGVEKLFLPAETITPASGSSLEDALCGSNLSWFALRTRSNFERQSAFSLSQKGLEVFLPSYHSRRRRWDRFVDLELPLFPGYLFCRFDFAHRLPVLMSPGIVHIVGSGSMPEPVPESEIMTVRAIVESNLRSEPWPFLEIGQPVKIIEGPLSGVEGLLLNAKGRHRLVVSITLLQRSIAAEIDATWVRPVSKSVARISAPVRPLPSAIR